MAKLIFKYTDELLKDNREAREIEFTVPDDMDINEFKVMCVRLAYAMGYTEKSITTSFGNLVFGDEDKNLLKDLIDELNFGRSNKKSK